tara:strand:- start:1602 stop:2153 length:552 start_codon:yes stop_codon:yes gene_type:complete
MVEPVTVMAGLAMLKKTVEVCSGAVDTCENISELGSHLNNLFKHHEQAKQKKEVKKKPVSQLTAWLSKQTNTSEEDSESLGVIAAEKIERIKVNKAIHKLSVQIDARFGQGVWQAILDERERRIKERLAAEELAKSNALRKAKEQRDHWNKIIKEVLKLLIVLTAFGIVALFVLWASTAPKIR